MIVERKIIVELVNSDQFQNLENIGINRNSIKFNPVHILLSNINRNGINSIKINTSDNHHLQKLYLTYVAEVSSTDAEDLIRLIKEINPVYVELNEFQKIHCEPTISEECLLSKFPFKDFHLDTIWQSTLGDGATVAVIDTDSNYHLNLSPKNIPQTKLERNLNENIHSTDILMLIGAPQDKNYHVGIAPNTSLHLLSEFKDKYGDSVNLSLLIHTASDMESVDVINLSWGPGKSKEIQRAILYAFSKGKYIVCSVGNNGAEVEHDSMAAMEETISVGACYANKSKYRNSNFGKFVDIWLPGAELNFFYKTNLIKEKSGTSYSAGLMSGFIALIVSRCKVMNKAVPQKNLLLKNIGSSIEGKHVFNIEKFINYLNSI